MDQEYVLPRSLSSSFAASAMEDGDDFEMVDPANSKQVRLEPPPTESAKTRFSTAALSPEEIQLSVQKVIGKEPSADRPVRVYVNGFYDMFHAGHALQLRQAKLSFPSVYLMVGVFSDAFCKYPNSSTVLDRMERMEVVRHCRWVDEVLPEAPWTIDEAFLEKWDIDYVCHNEQDAGGEFGYEIVKKMGKSLPTQRTTNVSSSMNIEKAGKVYNQRQRDRALTTAITTDTPEPTMDVYGIGL